MECKFQQKHAILAKEWFIDFNSKPFIYQANIKKNKKREKSWRDDVCIERKCVKKQLKKKKYFFESSKCKS